VKKLLWLGLVLIALPLRPADATGWRKDSNEIHVVNRRIRGKIVDYTANHGADNRIWSRSLFQRRDLYVYLPPGYDCNEQYPVMMLLHGFAQDEQLMLTFAPLIDDAITCGKLPPIIVACPDGSLHGQPCLCSPGSFFLNTKAGDFEDFLTCDVWDFLIKHYPIRCEREAHILAGVSMGGFAAYNLGIRHRDAYGAAIGVFPPLNLRWVDDHGNYRAKFDPHHWGWRRELKSPHEPIARFAGGLVTIRIGQLITPLFGDGEEALVGLSRDNPIELIDRTGLHDGELAMYVAYAGHDEFNIDAQVESFLYLCKFRGISVAVGYEPHGHHDIHTATRMLPNIFDWLAPLIAPYAPPMYLECGKERRRDRRGAVACPGDACLPEAGTGTIIDPQPEALPPPVPRGGANPGTVGRPQPEPLPPPVPRGEAPRGELLKRLP
jgi:S-formylglutathione hydrolase FrmB